MNNTPSKPTSVYYAKDRHKAKHLKWPVPLGGPGAFFTTWNALAGALVTCLAILCIPWMRVFKSTQKIAAFTIVPLCIAVMASIVCTTIISQMMFAFNVKIERSDDEPTKHKRKKLALSVNFVQKMLFHNFVWHLGPLIFVVILGLGITLMPSPTTLIGRGSVFLMSFVYFALFVLAWMVTPCKLDHEHGKPPITVMGWEKIKYVYRNPPSYYFTAIFPFIAVLVLIVGNFALYGALDQKGMRQF